MNFKLTPTEAVAQQRELRKQVRLEPLPRPPRIVAGADISYNRGDDTCHAGFVILDHATGQILAKYHATTEMTFPYVPGLLSYREIPPLLEAWAKIPEKPDLVFMDGHGIMHPRRLGIASHFGLAADVPTIGNGKSILIGKFTEPAPQRGAWSPMVDRGETVGAAVRTKNRVKPVYVSAGHRITLEEAIRYTLAMDGGYRIPEPTRQAHLLVNAVRRGEGVV